jgi:hypothetical protein
LTTDWSAREWDQKPDTRPGDNLDRAKPYMRFHKLLARGLYCMDVDYVEYAFVNGEPSPVAIIELTMVGIGKEPSRDYFGKIEARATQRDAQIKVLRWMARSWNVPLFYVAFETEEPTDEAVRKLEEVEAGAFLNRSVAALWVADVLDAAPPWDWKRHDPESYERFLRGLRSRERTVPMPDPKPTNRVESDEAKLHEAVSIYRTRAGLHGSSEDAALVRYAHEAGKAKPYADMVRDAWHDYRQACQYAEVPVEDYEIRKWKHLQRALPFDDPLPQRSKPATETVRDERLHSEPEQRSQRGESDGESFGGDEPPLSCPHQDRILDETEQNNVCTACGEILGCAHKVRINDGKGVTCDDCGELLGPAPPEHNLETARPEHSSQDEEEVLF